MKFWCMNLKDNRSEQDRNKDKELKFRLCKEKSIIAIGWCVPNTVHTWDEYREKADLIYCNNNGYPSAAGNLEKIRKGDYVWVKHPTEEEYHLAEVIDNLPGIYDTLKEFDICGYRRVKYVACKRGNELTGDLAPDKLKARSTLEQMHENNRLDTIRATEALIAQINS